MPNQPARGPVVFFGFTYLYGGSRHAVVTLAAEMCRIGQPVLVVDAYGACHEYARALAAADIPTRVLCPNPKMVGIGGRGLLRLFRLAVAFPHYARVIWRLRALAREVRPSALVVSSCPALVAARWALGRSVPIAYYCRGEVRQVPRRYARYISGLDLLIALAPECLAGLESFTRRPPPTAIVRNCVGAASRLADSEVSHPLPGIARELKLVFPGTVQHPKGQDIAIRALAQVRNSGVDAHLWLAGTAGHPHAIPYARECVRLARELRVLDRVSFLGWRDDILSVIKRSDVVILTSRTEGVPRSLMQAMALEKPVIATRVGGIPDLVRDGVDGYLINLEDVGQAAKAIEQLRDPALRARLGSQGRNRIEQEFSATRRVPEFLHQMAVLRRAPQLLRPAKGGRLRELIHNVLHALSWVGLCNWADVW